MTSDLQSARNALAAAVKELLDPGMTRVAVLGKLVDHHGLCLLDQVREHVEGSTSGKRGGGGRRSGSPVPIDLGAVDLVEEIDHMARTELWRQEPARFYVGKTLAARAPAIPLTTAQRIRNTARFVRAAATEPAHIEWLTTLLQEWSVRCKLQLDPERRLATACPACDAVYVERDQGGETVRVPAIVVSSVGPKCEACGHRFSGVVTPQLEVATDATAGEANG